MLGRPLSLLWQQGLRFDDQSPCTAIVAGGAGSGCDFRRAAPGGDQPPPAATNSGRSR